MRISEAIEAQRSYQQRLCEALELDPSVTADVVLNRAAERVEWTRLLEGADLNAYTVVRAGSSSTTVVLGLHLGQHVTVEQWKRARQIEDQWLEKFPTH